MGALIINLPISYQGGNKYKVLSNSIFGFQEINESLLAIGAYLYSFNLTKKLKALNILNKFLTFIFDKNLLRFRINL